MTKFDIAYKNYKAKPTEENKKYFDDILVTTGFLIPLIDTTNPDWTSILHTCENNEPHITVSSSVTECLRIEQYENTTMKRAALLSIEGLYEFALAYQKPVMLDVGSKRYVMSLDELKRLSDMYYKEYHVWEMPTDFVDEKDEAIVKQRIYEKTHCYLDFDAIIQWEVIINGFRPSEIRTIKKWI